MGLIAEAAALPRHLRNVLGDHLVHHSNHVKDLIYFFGFENFDPKALLQTQALHI